MADKKLPSFKKPPVTEVACGIKFEPLRQFLLPHIGLFWEQIRREFPEFQNAIPLLPGSMPQNWSVESLMGIFTPRAWFISSDKQRLVQLQADCLYYNWRRIAESDVYPRFPAVISSFDGIRSQFTKFLEQNNLPAPVPLSGELTYVNHIPREDGWKSMEDVAAVFRDFCWNATKGRFLPPPRNIGWNTVFELPNDAGTLNVSFLQVNRIPDQAPVLRLDISARGAIKDKSPQDIRAWFELAHEWIVQGFVDLTRPEIQKKVWEREDV